MRTLLCALLFAGLAPAAIAQPDAASVLDDFHQAASVADGDRYFGHFAENAIFMGTDISERWTLDEFKAYAEPHFGEGKGWTYLPRRRNIYMSEGGDTAWFDEILVNATFGDTRGSGVLVKRDGHWKVAQYHLTLPVPNALILDLVGMIKASDGQ